MQIIGVEWLASWRMKLVSDNETWAWLRSSFATWLDSLLWMRELQYWLDNDRSLCWGALTFRFVCSGSLTQRYVFCPFTCVTGLHLCMAWVRALAGVLVKTPAAFYFAASIIGSQDKFRLSPLRVSSTAQVLGASKYSADESVWLLVHDLLRLLPNILLMSQSGCLFTINDFNHTLKGPNGAVRDSYFPFLLFARTYFPFLFFSGGFVPRV